MRLQKGAPVTKTISRKRYWVGFDLGGTKMLAKIFDAQFRPLGSKRRKTRGHEGVEAGLARMVETVKDACADAGVSTRELAGIGVGVPGPLDLDKGVILETPNLGWKNVNLKRTLEKAFSCPAMICNDVDAGVYGEYRFGAGQDAHCVVGVFPGTGIGGGCVYEGRILRGERGSCMEIGHMPVEVGGPLCGCGRTGCLEAVAGRLAIASQAAKAAYRGDAPNLMADAGTDIAEIRSGALGRSVAAGDTAVERIIRDAAAKVGWTMAGVVNLLAPDVVLLGGGLVEEMSDLYVGEVKRALKDRVMPSFRKSYKVVAAELGDDAGVVGAAAWVQHMVEEA